MNRSFSLRGGSEFQRVWDNGKSWSHPLLILRCYANGTEVSRFGFVVGKKVGKAVKRNRAKRLMREAVRRRLKEIAKGWDVVFIARREAEQAEFQAIDQAVENLLRRARLYPISDPSTSLRTSL
ncbi:MAG: ribonuclease P protein component [Chloroflexi bacterium]|nr:ribonuclease P protein component [Chloroflexota bacterium]